MEPADIRASLMGRAPAIGSVAEWWDFISLFGSTVSVASWLADKDTDDQNLPGGDDTESSAFAARIAASRAAAVATEREAEADAATRAEVGARLAELVVKVEVNANRTWAWEAARLEKKRVAAQQARLDAQRAAAEGAAMFEAARQAQGLVFGAVNVHASGSCVRSVPQTITSTITTRVPTFLQHGPHAITHLPLLHHASLVNAKLLTQVQDAVRMAGCTWTGSQIGQIELDFDEWATKARAAHFIIVLFTPEYMAKFSVRSRASSHRFACALSSLPPPLLHLSGSLLTSRRHGPHRRD